LPHTPAKIEDGRQPSMKLPENVLAARERMAKADAALHAGIESDAPADKISHKLDELHLATDD
jgi:hypothetical protein